MSASRFIEAGHINVHPGGLLKRRFLEPRGMSPDDLAKEIGISRAALFRLVAEKQGMTARIAVALEKAGRYGDAATWMTLQANHELACEYQRLAKEDPEALRHLKGRAQAPSPDD